MSDSPAIQTPEDASGPAVSEQPERSRFFGRMRRVSQWLTRGVALLVALVVLAIGYLHTPPGRQLILDEISAFAPASGLSVEVESIKGSVLWSATFNNVRLRDAEDTLFLEVPTVELNWRPWVWFWSGLDVRHLVLANGTLYAAPVLIEGDPDAPLLPDFDIRIDNFLIDDLTIAAGLLGEERVVGLTAKVDIRKGVVHVEAAGNLGGEDKLALLIDAQPDNDVFDLALDWQAPRGGFLATMVGAQDDLAIRVAGDGSWTRWDGTLVARQGDVELLDFDLTNAAGTYSAIGRARLGAYLDGLPERALGPVVTLTASGTLVDSVLDGGFALRGRGVNADGRGKIDLAQNRFDGFALNADLLDANLFGPEVTLEGARLEALLTGPFRDLAVPHELTIARLDAGIVASRIRQEGTLRYDGTRFTIPLEASVARVTSGFAQIDPRLVNGAVSGTLTYAGNDLASDDLRVRFPGIAAQLGLASNLASGATRLTGPVAIANLAMPDLGMLDARARIDARFGEGAPWLVTSTLSATLAPITNGAITMIAGDRLALSGGVRVGGAQPLLFQNMVVEAPKLTATLSGDVSTAGTRIVASGTQSDYGDFTLTAMLADDGPTAELLLPSPFPAAGLADVRVALAPSDDGFRIETQGGSLLGRFDGLLDLQVPQDGDMRLAIERLDVAQSRISGALQFGEAGVSGDLGIAGGGLDGGIMLAPRAGGQGFALELSANQARLGSDTVVALGAGTVSANGLIRKGSTDLTVRADLQGLTYGGLYLARAIADATIENGRGRFDAALSGRRGSGFEMVVAGTIAPDVYTARAEGRYGGRDIVMPRRAVLTRSDAGGWELARTQLSYDAGFVIVSGRFDGESGMAGRLALSNLPLYVLDALAGDLGLGGRVSGLVELGSTGGEPTGSARLMVDGLTRSGQLLTSVPIDLALVAQLSPSDVQARAIISDDGSADGRVQGRIGLASGATLGERITRGELAAQLRFNGSAAALWRLLAIDLIDLSGPVTLAANASGNLINPQVRGTLEGEGMRLQSAITGTDVTDASVSGRFAGSRLNLTRFAGRTRDGGRVSGSGTIDLSGISATRGPSVDLRIAARDAQILNLPNMRARVTGPLRIVSNGVGGTIAGRLDVKRAFWKLGLVEEVAVLPNVSTTEINLPIDRASIRAASAPWRYLINVRAPGGLEVDGMGLDSEWRGDLRLRGTTDDPRLGGRVEIVPRQGYYSFAGVRFDITRGLINFDEDGPIDPRIDLLAETNVDSLTVGVTVQGSASQPEIAFTSNPALPEEELLARLLFGGSISDLSATDVLQLGAAVASLRGGSGIGPINDLRSAIGIDRLRIVPSDAALGRGTAVALGKNFGRRFYVEIITDGAGYNATDAEFRVTSWLNLLASISTIGRHSAAAEYRRDY